MLGFLTADLVLLCGYISTWSALFPKVFTQIVLNKDIADVPKSIN